MRTRSVMGAAVTGVAAVLLTATPAWAQSGSTQDGPAVSTTTDDGSRESLRAAIQDANARGGGVITLQRGKTYVLSITGDEDAAAAGDLDITSRISIDGNGATVDAGGIDRVLDVQAGGNLTIKNLTVTGGVADGTGLPASGGGIRNAGTLVVEGSVVTRNSAVRAGGGIEAGAGSTTTVRRSTLSKNATGAGPGNGGGLHITASGSVTVDRSVVTGNTAAAEGGGLWNDTMSTMAVTNSVISGNTAGGNDATNGGGGLFTIGGTLTVDRSVVSGNKATGTSGSGGGILNDAGTLVVRSSVIDGNSASRAGGGIEANVGTTTVEQTTLTRNTTGPNPGNGGGLHLTGGGKVTIDRGVVAGNKAANEGGGLWNSAAGTMTVTRTVVRGNSAPTGANVFQLPPGTGFTFDGRAVPAGQNNL